MSGRRPADRSIGPPHIPSVAHALGAFAPSAREVPSGSPLQSWWSEESNWRAIEFGPDVLGPGARCPEDHAQRRFVATNALRSVKQSHDRRHRSGRGCGHPEVKRASLARYEQHCHENPA
jgi:hypothetical protein